MLPWVGCTSLNDTRRHFEAHTEASCWGVEQRGMPSKETNVHAKRQRSLLQNSCQRSTGASLLFILLFISLKTVPQLQLKGRADLHM